MYVRLAALALAVTVVATSGCDGGPGIRAQFPNTEDTLTVYALNGTPITLPAALQLRTGLLTTVDANFSFDVAFDIDNQGQAHVLTPRVVAGQLVPVRRVGLLFSGDPFTAVDRAPASGYAYDTSYVLPVGKTLLIDTLEPTCSAYSILGRNIRAKLVLDSLNLSQRSLHVRVLFNPNCGFRQLTPGIPKE